MKNRGFSLIEVVISMALLAALVGTIANGSRWGSKMQKGVETTITASMLAEKVAPVIKDPDSCIYAMPPVTANVTTIPVPPPATFKIQLQQINFPPAKAEVIAPAPSPTTSPIKLGRIPGVAGVGISQLTLLNFVQLDGAKLGPTAFAASLYVETTRDGGKDSTFVGSPTLSFSVPVKFAATIPAVGQPAVINGCGNAYVPPMQYICPLHADLNNGCISTDRCQSTCLGQFQNLPTCSFYDFNGVPTVTQCLPTSLWTISKIYSCPDHFSSNCTDTSRCQTQCIGQYSQIAQCNAYQSGGSTGGGTVPYTCPALPAGSSALPQNLYLCPLQPSQECQTSSQCNSTCMGQYQSSPTCYYHLSGGGLPVYVNCKLLGTFTVQE